MPRKDSLSERLMKWLFWIVLVVYLFAGFYQVRYWLGEAFGWDFNQENDTLEVQGFGKVLEAGSFLITFLLLFGVYYLWKEASAKNNWESIFNNNKYYLERTKSTSITGINNIFFCLGRKSLWKTVFHILLIIGIAVVPIVIFLNILERFQILNTIILVGYGLLMLVLYLVGRQD